jgi:hypothetical protein
LFIARYSVIVFVFCYQDQDGKMSRGNNDILDATAHGSLTKAVWGASTVAMERTRSSSTVATLPSSSSVCERSPQRKSSKIRWIRRVPAHSGRKVNRGRGGLSQSQSQPQSLGEILSLVDTASRIEKNGGCHNHVFHQQNHQLHGSSRSVLSAGSRVSFAKDLEEVIDIPEYDNESRPKCFYSNRDLNEFRCEWEMEQDGLLPMQR